MSLVRIHHQDVFAGRLLEKELTLLLQDMEEQPVFVCIGSDRHLLDSFGPLTGTMLLEAEPRLKVAGTLHNPVHARNLLPSLRSVRQLHHSNPVVAIDAAVGSEDEMGLLQLRPGGLIPGRALAKNLPKVGDVSIIGVVDVRMSHHGSRQHPGLGLVYDMAKVLSQAIISWHRNQ